MLVTCIVAASLESNLLATSTMENTCCNNLRQIQTAAQMWAIENETSETNSYSLTDTNITKSFLLGIPTCPTGGQYSPGKTVANEPECSIHGSISKIILENEKRRRREKTRNIVLAVACVACFAGSIRLLFWVLRKQPLKNKS